MDMGVIKFRWIWGRPSTPGDGIAGGQPQCLCTNPTDKGGEAEPRCPPTSIPTHPGAPVCRKPLCGQGVLLAGGGALASPLFPADPPLAAAFPLQQAARRLPKECTGWSERASRACVRVCARPPVCVAADFIKDSQPRAAEARQPRVPRPRSCRKPTSIPQRQPGLQRGQGLPGGLPKMEAAGGSWPLGFN